MATYNIEDINNINNNNDDDDDAFFKKNRAYQYIQLWLFIPLNK